jgi:DNA-binding response OmpR family regulator
VQQSSRSNEKLIAELREQLDRAQARNRELQQLLQTQRGSLLEEIRLTPTQRKVVNILLGNKFCTRDHLYGELYLSKQGHKPDPKILHEMIRLVRRQLESHGIEISFVFGKGYTIPDESKGKLIELITKFEVKNGILYEGINLTPTQRKMVDTLLVTDGICTKEHLYNALYVSKQGYRPEPKVLREILRLVRRQLEPHGIEVKTVFGKGYIMPPESKAILKELIITRAT